MPSVSHIALEAEMAVLGAIMLADEVDTEEVRNHAADMLYEVMASLTVDDFAHMRHQKLFEVLRQRYAAGASLHRVQVLNDLIQRGLANYVDGAYLAQLSEAALGVHHMLAHATVVKERSRWRQCGRVGAVINDLVSRGDMGGTVTSDMLVSAIQHEVDGLTPVGHGQVRTIGELADDVMAWLDNPTAEQVFPTGIPSLDNLLNGGTRPGQLIVVAGRPGSGKSILGLQLAIAASRVGDYRATFTSLEMPESEVARRAMAAMAGVNYQRIMTGAIDPIERSKLARAAERLKERRLAVYAPPGITMGGWRAFQRQESRYGNLGVAVLDYLQLVQMNPRLASRQEQVAEASRIAKMMARELGIVVILLAQFNRNPEGRLDKRPQLSDLRESGGIEQDADVVIGAHQDQYYDPTVRPGEGDLIVMKQRGGPTGTVPVAAELGYMRFRDLAA